MKKFLALFTDFMVLVVLMALASVAFAVDAVTPAPAPITPSVVGAAVETFMGNVIFPVLAAFLMGLVGLMLTKISAKFKIDALIKNQELIEKFAFQGITYAEELASKAIAGKVTKITGKEKLDLAIANVIKNVPAISPEGAKVAVESMLSRVADVGADKKTALVVEGGLTKTP